MEGLESILLKMVKKGSDGNLFYGKSWNKVWMGIYCTERLK